jgi:hypothetical protein
LSKQKQSRVIIFNIEGKKIETKIIEKNVETFFDFFKNVEYSAQRLDAEEADFVRNDLIPYSMEYYLKISPNCQINGLIGEQDDK